MTAERIILAPSFTDASLISAANSVTYQKALQKLLEGYKMDPFFHQSGRPWTTEYGHVWVLVKGTSEEVAELNPFIVLPEPEEPEKPQPYVGLLTERIPFDKATGKPIREPPDGFVIMHKDHITTTGTVYTKLPEGR